MTQDGQYVPLEGTDPLLRRAIREEAALAFYSMAADADSRARWDADYSGPGQNATEYVIREGAQRLWRAVLENGDPDTMTRCAGCGHTHLQDGPAAECTDRGGPGFRWCPCPVFQWPGRTPDNPFAG